MTWFIALIAVLFLVAFGLLAHELLLRYAERHELEGRQGVDAEHEAEQHARPTGNVLVLRRFRAPLENDDETPT